MNQPLIDTYTCGVCLSLCEWPSLFECGEHFHCARCIRAWTASKREYDEKTKSYSFMTSCPKCRALDEASERPLAMATSSAIQVLHSSSPKACPFCNVNHATKQHVSTCNAWPVMCIHCKTNVPYERLDAHNRECGWRCPYLGCVDGNGLTFDKQDEHVKNHQVLEIQRLRLTATSTLNFESNWKRVRATEIYSEAAQQLLELAKEEEEEEEEDTDIAAEMSDVGDESVSSGYASTEFLYTPYTIDTVALIDQQMQIEDMLIRQHIPTLSERMLLVDKWYDIKDQLPSMSLNEWINKYNDLWTLYPSHVKQRLSNPILDCPT